MTRIYISVICVFLVSCLPVPLGFQQNTNCAFSTTQGDESLILNSSTVSVDPADIFNELNIARQYPAKYAEYLESLKPYFRGNELSLPGRITVITSEGYKAVDEAVRFLKKVKPLSQLKFSQALAFASEDLVKMQGATKETGHHGPDGSTPESRISKYGRWRETYGENIAYGGYSAREFVMNLIIDDGVPSRGHRKNIFNPAFKIVGIAAGTHKSYGTMCVIDFVGSFTEKNRN